MTLSSDLLSPFAIAAIDSFRVAVQMGRLNHSDLVGFLLEFHGGSASAVLMAMPTNYPNPKTREFWIGIRDRLRIIADEQTERVKLDARTAGVDRLMAIIRATAPVSAPRVRNPHGFREIKGGRS